MWDERAPAHAASADYGFERFAAEPDFISDVVRFDLPRLGDIRGARGVHLQCHIGTDTLSLSRLGADMTGLDFSAASLAEARKLAPKLRFVEGDAYDAVEPLIWVPGVRGGAGVRLEDTIMVDRDGGRALTRTAFDERLLL